MTTKITLISDTHSRHNKITDDLIGGDVLLHSGDISEKGYEYEIIKFLDWFSDLPYERKIFIAGNHDFYFEHYPSQVKELLKDYPSVTYLEDNMTLLGEEWEEYTDRPKVWGSPWQPRFFNWAFNIDRDSDQLEDKWNMIPPDVDILLTHGPPKGILDYVARDHYNAGCERLMPKIYDIKPKIHVFGHIHEGYGYKFENETMFINASVLNGRYDYRNKPVNIEFDENGRVKLL